MYNELSREHIKDFKKILASGCVLEDSKEALNWGLDWTKHYTPNPAIVLFPKTSLEVSKLLSFCNQHRLAVVTSGGRTGLAGGAVAANKEIIISLDKMNKIISVDTIGSSICVEAGVITEKAQQVAQQHDALYPIDLAAKGSSQIGGNIATNAGGLKFVRYGGMRDHVLGLEVVLADGSIMDLDSSLRKNNTGYDLKQLFIGSEGTLGIITKATISLARKPKDLALCCVGVNSIDDLLQILTNLNKQDILISAFEFFSLAAHEHVLRVHKEVETPFEKKHPYYGVLEIETDRAQQKLEDFLASIWDEGSLQDARLSSSSQEYKYIWSLRELITESLQTEHHIRKNDIALPLKDLANFVDKFVKKKNDLQLTEIDCVFFGHLADGNIHVNHLSPTSVTEDKFWTLSQKYEDIIKELLIFYKGSISAEHGIGLLKKDSLSVSRSPQEIEYMKSIKKIFDPNCILNPGKIFDN
jgi:FAD/FMN-containing dehydrogenase